jgi:hypothetical protein
VYVYVYLSRVGLSRVFSRMIAFFFAQCSVVELCLKTQKIYNTTQNDHLIKAAVKCVVYITNITSLCRINIFSLTLTLILP